MSLSRSNSIRSSISSVSSTASASASVAPTSSSSLASASASTRLPTDCIPQIELNDSDIETYRRLTSAILDKTLAAEIAFRYEQNEQLNAHEWKFLKGKDSLRVYKRTAAPVSNNDKDEDASMVVGVGFLEGTVEDALYGLHHKTTEEMRMTSQFINTGIIDAVVLSTIETGTDEDPFRYFGLKWRAAHTPGPSKFIKDRDVCNIESMGLRTDSQDIPFGFQVLRSVDVPEFKPFSDSVMVRAEMTLCCIFRQVSPNVVAFYGSGAFNLCGELADFISYSTSADMVLSIANAVDCAVAKRLTLHVIEREAAAAATAASSVDSDEDNRPLVSRQRSLRLVASERDVCKGAQCTKCLKKPSLLSASCRPCQLCVAQVCSKCSIKTHLLARPRRVRIVCCKDCAFMSKDIVVDPRAPYPILALHESAVAA